MDKRFAIVLFGLTSAIALSADSTVYLSDLKPIRAEQAWGPLNSDKSVEGKPLNLGGKIYKKGVGTHAHSQLIYLLSGKTKRFTAIVGLDDEVRKYIDTPEWKSRKPASARFRVVISGKTLFDSGVMRYDTPPKRVDVALNGAGMLDLIVDDIDNDNYAAHADWADAKISFSKPKMAQDNTVAFSVTSPKLSILLTQDGRVVGIRFGKGAFEPFKATTQIAGLDGPVSAKQTGNKVTFSRKLPKGGTWKETFSPQQNGIRWVTDVKTFGKPWTTPFETGIVWSKPKTSKVWTAWGGPYVWQDPLEPKPFANMGFEYGAFYAREGGISLPLITVLDEKRDLGLTLAQSPEDKIINMLVQVHQNGEIKFVRAFQRFGEGRTWRASMDLIAHEADFRPALGWMVARYPRFFRAPIALAQEVGGHGAYSGEEGNLDAPKLHNMGFSFNWKASIDFPYMGMFIPPVDANEKWNRFAGGGGGGYSESDQGRFGSTSITQLNDYSKRMKAMGFHVLSYFNVTEFGGNIVFPKPPSKNLSEKDLWKNPSDFLYTKFPKAMLLTPDNPIGSWGGTVVMDPGEKAYQDFLIEQAQRHIDVIPEADGICIDRMDWLTLFNPHADDGVSWIDGPQRSLFESWHSLMARLEPLMHKNNKVIFGNAMIRRPDLTSYLDGIYDEHGDYGYNLNTSAYLCLLKPNVAWTRDESQLKPDPDRFMQRFLYMGAFMTAPVPGNDHTIWPSEWTDKVYLDYGPLFNTIKGREWVLSSHAISVTDHKAKANLFKIADGYVIVVAFGGDEARVEIRLKGLPMSLDAQYLFPGIEPSLSTVRIDTTEVLDVPLIRGCAVVKLTRPH